MRKIEQAMVDAVHAGRDWNQANTQVTHTEDGGEVFLHGHRIAILDKVNGRILPDLDTLAEWPTVTTRSRLRALGLNVYSDRGYTCYDGAPIAPSI